MRKCILAVFVLLASIYIPHSVKGADEVWQKMATNFVQKYMEARQNDPFGILYWTRKHDGSSKSSSGSGSNESGERRPHGRRKERKMMKIIGAQEMDGQGPRELGQFEPFVRSGKGLLEQWMSMKGQQQEPGKAKDKEKE